MLTLKCINMKETAINSSIRPTTDLETNFTKSLKRDCLLNPQLKVSVHKIQYYALQSSFPCLIFLVARIDCNRLSDCNGILLHNHVVPK